MLKVAVEHDAKSIINFIRSSKKNRGVFNLNFINSEEWLSLRGYRAAVFSSNYIVLISKSDGSNIDGVMILQNYDKSFNLTSLNVVNAVIKSDAIIDHAEISRIFNKTGVTKIKITMNKDCEDLTARLGLSNKEILNFNNETLYVYSEILDGEKV
ncbi:hypothetical protein [Enterococcus devriesei]|uniref:hypothetical protein n=1 Tax=Enterococcus devriesei TaxID=319970 RepID=UPI0036D3B671